MRTMAVRVAGTGTLSSVKSANSGELPSTNLIYQLNNTTFHGPGRYRFLVDAGRTRVLLPLRVMTRDI